MKKLCLILLLAAVPALADILPDEVATCRDKSAGAACTTPEGQPGTCAKMTISRPDYSSGIPPKYKSVEMLGCVATAKGSARSMLPWLGAGLAFLAALAALWRRPRPPAAATA